MRRLLLFCLLPLGLLCAGQSNDPNLVTIRLHAEANEKDTDTFAAPITLTNPPKKIFIGNVPIVTERDITEFYPFAANDGSIGCYFRLDADGTHKLNGHTIEKRDTMVVAMINGRVACAMMVDKKIDDGILYIPSGFLPIEIAKLQAKFPIMGKEKEFEQQKKTAIAKLKEARKNEPKPSPAPKEKK